MKIRKLGSIGRVKVFQLYMCMNKQLHQTVCFGYFSRQLFTTCLVCRLGNRIQSPEVFPPTPRQGNDVHYDFNQIVTQASSWKNHRKITTCLGGFRPTLS